MTEVIRYSFYACSLVGMTIPALLYLRYSMFYILYPTGAFSEAFLIYAALPAYPPFPGWQSWLHGMWKPTDYVRLGLFIIWWPSNYTPWLAHNFFLINLSQVYMSCILTCFFRDGKYLGLGSKKHIELVRIYILVTSRTVFKIYSTWWGHIFFSLNHHDLPGLGFIVSFSTSLVRFQAEAMWNARWWFRWNNSPQATSSMQYIRARFRIPLNCESYYHGRTMDVVGEWFVFFFPCQPFCHGFRHASSPTCLYCWRTYGSRGWHESLLLVWTRAWQ